MNDRPTKDAAQARGACNCDEAVAELWAYLDSELEALEAARVKAHLEGCRGCLEEHDVELVVKKLVRRCYQEEDAAPEQLRARIHASLTTVHVDGASVAMEYTEVTTEAPGRTLGS